MEQSPIERRIGRVKMTRALVMASECELTCFFAHFVPVGITVDLISDTVEYIGFSKLFRPVPEGSEAPVYTVGFSRIGDVTILNSIT